MIDWLRRQLAVPQPAEKAATGIGVAWVQNEPMLSSYVRDDQGKAKRAQEIGTSNRWVRAAERVISTTLGGVDWHLETDDDEPVTDESDERLRRVRDLLEKPYRPKEGDPLRPFPRTRSGLWGITSRHFGVGGYSFWYCDARDEWGIPDSLLYINPARMWPSGEKGNIMGWILDKDAAGRGTPLDAKDVLMFTLEEPDFGWFPAGLVETAMTVAQITRQSDMHASKTMATGGKKSGVFAPTPAGGVLPSDVFETLEKQLRSEQEDPGWFRRDMILKGPVSFTERSSTNQELDLIALMNLSRDDILELWGVPRSQLGGETAAGLNSGQTKSYDEAALWQKAIHPRLVRMWETIQYQLLDPISINLGKKVELELEEPTFDDDAPMYELAKSALNLPLRNSERRAIIGMDPLGDDVLDNAIWLPLNIVEAAAAPQPEQKAKQSVDSLIPKLQKDIAAFLAEQKREVEARIRKNAAHIAKKPTDDAAWWDGKKWDAALQKVLAPYAKQAADLAVVTTSAKLGTGKAGEAADLFGTSVFNRLLAQVGRRVTGINETTRQEIEDLIAQGLEAGKSPSAVADDLEDFAGFAEYRSELIARTETATVMNLANTETYREFGVETVRVIDGDGDEICASADGQEWTLEEAEADPLGHPNCVRDFAPIVGRASLASGQLPATAGPPIMPKANPEQVIRFVHEFAPSNVVVNTPDVHVHTPEQQAPIVNATTYVEPVVVPAPQVTVEGAVVHVPPTEVSVKADVAAPSVTFNQPEHVQDIRIVDMPARTSTSRKKVKRDERGLIKEVLEETVDQ